VVDLAATGGPAIIATDPGARASDQVLIVGRRAYVWQAKRWQPTARRVFRRHLAAEGR
jgi:hypothetical protein